MNNDYTAQDSVQKSLTIIEKQLPEKTDISQLAADACFSKYHYQRLFHKIVGEPVMEYVKKRRLSLAALEIRESSRSILEIALKYGYQSHESFTRAFKAFHGVTPSECRKYDVSLFYSSVLHSSHIRKERSPMTAANKTAEQVFNSASETIRYLNQIVVQLNEAGQQTEKTALRLGGQFFSAPRPLPNFQILANETKNLASRAKSACDVIQEIHQACQKDAFSIINQRLSLIKVLEDTVTEINLLTFAVHLQIARTIPDPQLPELADTYSRLAQNAAAQVSTRISSFENLVQLIYEDIVENCRFPLKQMQNILQNLMHEIQKTQRNFRKITPQNEFHMIAGELDTLIFKLKKISASLEDFNQEKNPCVLTWACDPMMEQMTRLDQYLRTLTLNCRLDAQRAPEDEIVQKNASKLSRLSEQFEDAVQDCRQEWDEIRRLSSLYEQSTKRSNEAYTDDFNRKTAYDNGVCHTAILNYHLRSEISKFFALLSEEQQQRFSKLKQELPIPSSEEERDAAAMRDALQTVARRLRKEGEEKEQIRSVMSFFAKQYESMAAVFEGLSR